MVLNNKQVHQVEKSLKVVFKDKNLLQLSLTHRSFLNESHLQQKTESNERLEFLGDAILEFIISEMLYRKFPQKEEGWLTNLRSNVVRTTALAQIAETLGFGQYVLMSRGEKEAKGNQNPSILADTTEAIIGALYLDQGLKKTQDFIEANFMSIWEEWVKRGELKDAKSLLQEKIQINSNPPPIYKILKETGPDHQKVFIVGVYLKDELLAEGKGKSKREAEANAAQKVLAKEV